MRLIEVLLVGFALCELTACGGAGDTPSTSPGGGTTSPSSTPPSTAEGVYGGTIAGGSFPSFEGIVLENGDGWVLYGQNSGSTFYVYGFLQGSGVSSNGTYSSSNVKDFGFYPAVTGTLTATYSATAKTISGSSTFNSITQRFSGGPISGATYNYDTAASLASVTGRWSLLTLQGEGVALNVGANGAFTLLGSSGCQGSGTVSPRGSGKNVFDIVINFGPSPCTLPNKSATGVAITYLLSTGQTQLIGAAIDSGRTVGTAVFGVR